MDYSQFVLGNVKRYMDKNYDYAYLRSTFERGINIKGSNANLVTGSSHSMCAIDVRIMKNTINCSMHSQDLYYDFKCAKEILEKNPYSFKRCFIVMGYYVASQDLSKGVRAGNEIIEKVYYPLFGDVRNCIEFNKYNPRDGFELEEGYAEKIEKMVIERLNMVENYFNVYKKRVPYLPRALQGFRYCEWNLHTEEEKAILGRARADEHHKFVNYKETFYENKEIFRDYIHYLSIKDIEPIVVVMPFTNQFAKYIENEQKQMFYELLDCAYEDVQFIDFNEATCFDDNDFMDADHVNESGARKISTILADMFDIY